MAIQKLDDKIRWVEENEEVRVQKSIDRIRTFLAGTERIFSQVALNAAYLVNLMS